jgi:enoyl-[acyl-carrier protein] reductase/trans-2-enoyl-CoA reductase (NAD+)
MIHEPMVRNNICINAHPKGCEVETRRQIEHISARKPRYAALPDKPRAVLVVGASTGYGLASRIGAAFGFGAITVGVSFEKAPTDSRTGTPGWYNNRTFDAEAKKAGLDSKSIDGDAFSKEIKAAAVAAAKDLGITYDLVIYSLAAPNRTDPVTGITYQSVIKPIGEVYRGKSVNVFTGEFSEASIEPANEEDITATVKVMGGEDWELWIEALDEGGVLSSDAKTVAYSYIGPALSWPIYRDGTIGRAKAHLEETAPRLASRFASRGLSVYVSINKALVTRASAVIPVIPLYVSTLFKVMKERGTHEDCAAQIDRLYRDRLYSGRAGGPPVDSEGRIRLDDLEMLQGVQAEIEARMSHVTQENLKKLADVDGFRIDFLRAHGFEVPTVNYSLDVPSDYDPALSA